MRISKSYLQEALLGWPKSHARRQLATLKAYRHGRSGLRFVLTVPALSAELMRELLAAMGSIPEEDECQDQHEARNHVPTGASDAD
jgi:hypothetical protein